VINTPKRVEVPKKTTQARSIVKRGKVALNKSPRKEKMRHL
jgi:hypothetical protein